MITAPLTFVFMSLCTPFGAFTPGRTRGSHRQSYLAVCGFGDAISEAQ